MIRTTFALAIMLLAAAVLAGDAPDASAGDPAELSGDWILEMTIEGTGTQFDGTSVYCIAHFEREGESLVAALSCEGAGAGTLTGTLDGGGEFGLSGLVYDRAFTLDGTVTGPNAIEGTWSFGDGHGPFDGEPAYLPWGDMSCDRRATARDAELVLQSDARLLYIRPLGYCLFLADVDLSSHVDSSDALLILQLEAGLIPRLPVW